MMMMMMMMMGIYRGGLPTRRWTPIHVLTGFDVDVLGPHTATGVLPLLAHKCGTLCPPN